MKYLFVLIAIALFSCSDFLDQNHVSIDPELQPFYDSFINEAHQRGLYFNPEVITIEFEKLTNGNAGMCYWKENRISFDSTSFQYKQNPEGLVFHELGHLILRRKHDYSPNLKNNDTKSLMAVSGITIYTGVYSYKREYYVNELFNQNEKAPDWSN